MGCILLDPSGVVGACVEKFKDGGTEFYDLRHQTIYQTMVELWDGRDPIDFVSLQERLKLWGNLEQVGGALYLATLPDQAGPPANFGYYLDVVLEKHRLRKMIRVCTEAVGKIYDSEAEADAVLEETERDVLRAIEGRTTADSFTIAELIQRAIHSIEDYHSNQGQLTGVGTGFQDFDKLTTGLHGGEMVVIAARPSMGKTSLAMNIAEHVALNLSLPVGVFSLEMSSDSLALRLLCSRARVNIRNVRDGFLAERDFPKLTGAAGRIAHSPLFIDDSSGLSIMQLRAKARRMHQKHDIKLFVIDYLQLLHSTSRRADNRQQEISDISSGIKSLSKELNVPVIVLSQLNRDIEREKNRKPKLSDLRESGSIEQDADLVGLLYRPTHEEYDEEDQSEAVPINLLIAKQRNGPAGEDVHLTFIKPYTRFESAAKVSDEDVPDNQPQMDYAP